MHSQHSVFLRLLYSSQDYWSNTGTNSAMAARLLVPYRSPNGKWGSSVELTVLMMMRTIARRGRMNCVKCDLARKDKLRASHSEACHRRLVTSEVRELPEDSLKLD